MAASQRPTQLELEQIEAMRLEEEISKLYARLPQATEEADAQVVHELTKRLKRLLELERFCTPVPGIDGAEWLERLRKAHSTSWNQTAYGAEARKELTALLEQAYTAALKREAAPKGEATKMQVNKTPDGVAGLAKVLGQLAVLCQEQGTETGDLAYHTEAAVLYQNLLHVCEGEKKKQKSQGVEGCEAQIAAAYSGLAQIRETMLASIGGGAVRDVGPGGMSVAKLQAEIARDRQVLQAIREDARTRVAELEDLLNKQGSPAEETAGEQEYIEGSRTLFRDIAKGVREFLARLYQEGEQELGPAPCKYTVMGLGSMALAQMTPYSDLEFAILMEEAPDTVTAEKHRAYLRQLTHLVHFRVINLGETVIPTSKYKINLDHLGRKGLNFDLGGKTPLGRKDKPHLKEPYELIQPVSAMMDYLKNEGDKMEHMDKLLPYILESTCYVHGDEELHATYVAEKNKFFTDIKTEQRFPVYKARSLKKLLEGVVEVDYSKPGTTKFKRQQLGDLADFEPKFDYHDVGRLYDVKQEIYRLPDRLLYRLAMYYGILPDSGWDAVEQLANQGIIGQGESARKAVHHLQYAVSFATMLRLRTYLHHEQQGERVQVVTVASQKESVQDMFVLPKAALEAGGSLFKYYYTALPLHGKMKEMFRDDMDTSRKEAGFFQGEAFYDESDQTRGTIHRRLHQPEAAVASYELDLQVTQKARSAEHPDVAISLNNLGSVWDQLGNPKQAIECCKRAVAINEQAYSPKHPEVAMSLNNLGSAWYQLGDQEQAIECFKRALAIVEQAYDPDHPEVATVVNNLGLACEQLRDLEQAIEHFKRALVIDEQTYGPHHPKVAMTLNNLGLALYQLSDLKQAVEYYERALTINEQAYGPYHPTVATNLNNLGGAWSELGDPKQAIEYYERALPIYQQVYSSEHPNAATNLNNLGSVWKQLGESKRAITYFEQALSVYEKAYGLEHPLVATSLNNLGSAWDELGNPKQAIECFMRALAINEQTYGPKHPNVATNLNNLGGAWHQLGDCKHAITYLGRALVIDEQTYGPEHPSVATNLNNLGLAWAQLGDPKQAIEYLKRALTIDEQAYRPDHPLVATRLNNLGSACDQLGNSKEAIRYYERALTINEQAYGVDHLKVAANFNNLGLAWAQLGDPKQAISYLKQALTIDEQAYHPDHPLVASRLNNLGDCWNKLGDPKQAISYFRRALAIYEQAYGPKHPNVATSLNNLGDAWNQLGDPKQAIEYLKRALAIDEQIYGLEHPLVATRLINLGSAWDQLGDPKQAIEYFKRALVIYEQTYGLDHPKVATILNNLGLACDQLRDLKQAIECYWRALTIIVHAHSPEPLQVAAILSNLGDAYGQSGDSKQAIFYFEQALRIMKKVYGEDHPSTQTIERNIEQFAGRPANM